MKYFNRVVAGIVFFAAVLFFLSGCSFIMQQPMKPKSPEVGLKTQAGKRLEKLPDPKSKIAAAVYSFRDQTGQYKMSERGGTYSTAVPQGGAAMLLQAMENSKWFTPIERAGLGNLLQERKIIRSSRSAYNQGNSGSKLPPLLFAGVLLEGGIISYDHNVKTGGIGVRYFGAGGSGDYRQDRVTVYLRAVSTKNGKVLKSVNATKTVLSQKVDAGIFRYVEFKRLLEAETGVTYNEPKHLAVKSAISKALESLVIEGIFDEIWQLKNPEAIDSEIIQSYVKEKEERGRTDQFGMQTMPRPYSFSVMISGGMTRYAGDYSPPVERPQMDVSFGYRLNKNWHSYIGFGNSYLAAKPRFYQAFSYMRLGMRYHFMPEKVYTPFLSAEGGAFSESPTAYERVLPRQYDQLYWHSGLSGGFRYYLDDARRFGIEASVKFNYFYSDKIDGVVHGIYNDFYWLGNFGLSFSF